MTFPPPTAQGPNSSVAVNRDSPRASLTFRCAHCYNLLANGNNYLADLYPLSMVHLLFDNGVTGVVYGAESVGVRGEYVGEPNYGSHVDMVPVNCTDCGNSVGMHMIRVYDPYHPFIMEGGFILTRGDTTGIHIVHPNS